MAQESTPLKKQLHVFPNPASKEITIVLPATENKPAEASLFNATGKLIKQVSFAPAAGNQLKMQVENAPAGIYLLQFQQGAQIYRQKLIVAPE